MDAVQENLDRLAKATRWNYRAGRESAAEPAAWSTIALAAHGRATDALRPAAWLAGLQQANGAVGVSAAEREPRWPTSVSLLAWRVVDRATESTSFQQHIDLAVGWSLEDRGQTAPNSPHVGHDSMLTGWSWAAGTHSWLEPTCYFVLALAATDQREHARTQEGVRLVRDRLLPDGGANYGNTIVLGQALLPHLQPTGLAMLTLAGEGDADGRIERSFAYLERAIDASTAPLSFSFACLGLAAHGRRPAQVDAWTAEILQRRGDAEIGSLERSLLLLAALADVHWLPRAEAPGSTPKLAERPA